MEQQEGTTPQTLDAFLDNVFGAVAPGHGWDGMPGLEWLTTVEELIGAHPGAAKSKLATELANQLWEEKGKASHIACSRMRPLRNGWSISLPTVKGTSSDLPIHEDALWFPLWIIDEIDFGRFAGEWDIQQVSANYPAQTEHDTPMGLEPVKRLASAFGKTLSPVARRG